MPLAPEPQLAPRTVDAVVLSWLAEPLLRSCVEALLASEKVDVRVILVDNGATTDDVEVLEQYPRVSVLRPGRNLGFSGGCNAGAAVGSGHYLALINGDAIVGPATLARFVGEPGPGPEGCVPPGAVGAARAPPRPNSHGNPRRPVRVSGGGAVRAS